MFLFLRIFFITFNKKKAFEFHLNLKEEHFCRNINNYRISQADRTNKKTKLASNSMAYSITARSVVFLKPEFIASDEARADVTF